MPTVWDEATRHSLVARVQQLTPGHQPRWGRFHAAGMVAHLNDATRMALGELAVRANTPAFLRLAPMRYLLVHHLPMPRGAPTAAELLQRCGDADLAAEQAQFSALLQRFATSQAIADTHPVFGRMTRRDWGVLMHKHTHHHLTQFAV